MPLQPDILPDPGPDQNIANAPPSQLPMGGINAGRQVVQLPPPVARPAPAPAPAPAGDAIGRAGNYITPGFLFEWYSIKPT